MNFVKIFYFVTSFKLIFFFLVCHLFIWSFQYYIDWAVCWALSTVLYVHYFFMYICVLILKSAYCLIIISIINFVAVSCLRFKMCQTLNIASDEWFSVLLVFFVFFCQKVGVVCNIFMCKASVFYQWRLFLLKCNFV